VTILIFNNLQFIAWLSPSALHGTYANAYFYHPLNGFADCYHLVALAVMKSPEKT
jgi:hypothetical protein